MKATRPLTPRQLAKEILRLRVLLIRATVATAAGDAERAKHLQAQADAVVKCLPNAQQIMVLVQIDRRVTGPVTRIIQRRGGLLQVTDI